MMVLTCEMEMSMLLLPFLLLLLAYRQSHRRVDFSENFEFFRHFVSVEQRYHQRQNALTNDNYRQIHSKANTNAYGSGIFGAS
jgi:hypothetical protein